MFNNIKTRFISAIAPDLPSLPSSDRENARSNLRLSNAQLQMQDKFAYARPPFLQLLTHDELRASADHNVRPIIVPRDINLLPWGTGYAECVNSGKSAWNEDQGAFCRQVLSDPEHNHPDLPYTYFGIFDGHAGYGAALAASHQFHHILHEKLVDCIELLLPRDTDQTNDVKVNRYFPHPIHFQRRISKDELIFGALESAFLHMDALIAQDRYRYRDAGGCTACVALFIDGKMYVANAGDSRAVLCQRKAIKAPTVADGGVDDIAKAEIAIVESDTYPVPFSSDHTPETERERLLNVARLLPHLIGKHYVAMEYAKRPNIRDLGQRILYRQGTMKGWAYKTLTREDVRMPVVTGEGKRSRLLGTLGVTRGFGDHDLLAINTGTQIKPFLTPHPDIKQRDLTQVVSIPDENNEDGDYGILVMATDGLWDVSDNEAVARTVFQTLSKYPTEKHRYTMTAQELVARARGKINDSGHWRLADSKAAATVDDISVIVIPVYQYYKEHVEWTQKCARDCEERRKLSKAIEAKEEAQDPSLIFNGSVLVEEGTNAAFVVEEGNETVKSIPDGEHRINTDEEISVELSANSQRDELLSAATSLEKVKLSITDEKDAAILTATTSEADSISLDNTPKTKPNIQQQKQQQQRNRRGKH